MLDYINTEEIGEPCMRIYRNTACGHKQLTFVYVPSRVGTVEPVIFRGRNIRGVEQYYFIVTLLDNIFVVAACLYCRQM